MKKVEVSKEEFDFFVDTHQTPLLYTDHYVDEERLTVLSYYDKTKGPWPDGVVAWKHVKWHGEEVYFLAR